MAEPIESKISVATPFGPIAATGTAAIMGLLIVILLGYLYFEMDKIGDEFTALRNHMDERFKATADVQQYNACLSRLTLWRSGQPRDAPINFDALPAEFYLCLPRFLVDQKR